MNVKEENICRICLNISENEYEMIDGSVKEMLDVLAINMNLDVSEDPIMCLMCSEMVKRSYMFKSTCVDTKGCDKGEDKFEIKNIYDGSVDADPGNIDFNICQFCTNRVEKSDSITGDVIMNDSKFTEVLRFLLEKDIKISTICALCKENLECYFNLTRTCLKTDEKINVYCQHQGTNSMGQVKLNRILRSLAEDSSKCFDECPKVCVLKKETCTSEEINDIHFEACDELIKTEELDIKDETSLSEDSPEISHKDTLTESRYKCLLCTFSTKYKYNFKRHLPIHEDPFWVHMYSCALCTYTKYGTNFHDHLLKHTFSPEVKIFKCAECTFETKVLRDFKEHLVNHILAIEMFKCPVCNFETQHEDTFNIHLLNHRDGSDDKVFKCILCRFESDYAISFSNHFVIHTDNREVKIYKCSMCTYQGTSMMDVRRHMLLHVDMQMIERYKYNFSTFDMKQRNSLKIHMLSHNNSSKRETYKCEACSCEIKFKDHFQCHMLIHTKVSKVEVYKCHLCPYKTINKGNLRSHSRSHEGISKEKGSETTLKDSSKGPTLSHDAATGSKIHNCTVCDFVTLHRDRLYWHMLTHKNFSKTGMYSCTVCTFKTKYKSSLKNHIVTHKDSSQVEMYKCSSCSYTSKFKRNVTKHQQVHRR